MSGSTLFLIAAELEATLLFGESFDARDDVRVAGVGRDGDAAAAAAIESTDAHRIVNVGFAGGLGAEASAGSVHVVREWTELEAPTAPVALADELMSALADAGLAAGSSVATTVDSPVADRAEGSRLAGGGADLVEMEGAAWAKLAARRGLPFVALRVVSDEANLELPGMRHELLTPQGGVNWRAWWAASRLPRGTMGPRYRAILEARDEWRTAVRTLRAVGRVLADVR